MAGPRIVFQIHSEIMGSADLVEIFWKLDLLGAGLFFKGS